MQVTSAGVRVYVKNPSKSGKGISGGFAVGKYASAKGDGEILVVNSGATNVYVDDDDAKGISGGFAVGKYASAKNKGDGNMLIVSQDSTRIYTDCIW
jgi:S-adenosylhomocysteine hydrolase